MLRGISMRLCLLWSVSFIVFCGFHLERVLSYLSSYFLWFTIQNYIISISQYLWSIKLKINPIICLVNIVCCNKIITKRIITFIHLFYINYLNFFIVFFPVQKLTVICFLACLVCWNINSNLCMWTQDAALASLKSLTRVDVVEVRALQRPPDGVRLVIETVCIMKVNSEPFAPGGELHKGRGVRGQRGIVNNRLWEIDM